MIKEDTHLLAQRTSQTQHHVLNIGFAGNLIGGNFFF